MRILSCAASSHGNNIRTVLPMCARADGVVGDVHIAFGRFDGIRAVEEATVW